MKRNMSLYIAGRKVDLDDSSLILFNYLMSDLDNPVIVKNSYSHQITIKGTRNNNKIFGSVFRLDRQTLYAEHFTGSFFDPMRKTPFEIYDETSNCIESGYVKLNKVTRKGEEVSYSISLFGGLGSFLYGLSYKEDGSSLSLGDLIFYNNSGTVADFLLSNCAEKGHEYINDAWNYLQNGYAATGTLDKNKWWHIVNFAPAYNGLPKSFDTKKALVSYSSIANETDAPSTTINNETYGANRDAGDLALILLENDHTEAEMNDYRWYLQRPVINMGEFLKAVADPSNNGGYSVYLDETFFNKNNGGLITSRYDQDLWMTLPLIAENDRTNDSCIKNILNLTNTPAEYLLSYVKMFNLVLICNNRQKRIEILTRQTFYSKGYNMGVIDLSKRIDMSSLEVVPSVVENKYYQMGGKVQGENASNYLKETGKEYGVQVIDTPYEFDNKTKNLTESICFREAVDVCESSDCFLSVNTKRGTTKKIVPFPVFESVQIQLWLGENNDFKSKNFNMYASLKDNNVTYFNATYPGYDKFNKIQLHEENNNAIDGSNVLVFFNGFAGAEVLITRDVPAFEILNDGKPCWLYGVKDTKYVKNRTVPRFNRTYVKLNSSLNLLYWGKPDKLFTKGWMELRSESNYESRWKGYLSDLLSNDNKMIRCKVNLKGLPMGTDLLRRFFWIGNSLWVLNKISNFSITTFDDVDCEFIKVQDINNYLV